MTKRRLNTTLVKIGINNTKLTSSHDMWRLLNYFKEGLPHIANCLYYSCVWCCSHADKAVIHKQSSWWRHQMETFSTLLPLCAVTGEFPSQRRVTRSFDVFFDPRLNKRLSKQSRRWWFKTPCHSLWRHCNVGAQLCERGHPRDGWITMLRITTQLPDYVIKLKHFPRY